MTNQPPNPNASSVIDFALRYSAALDKQDLAALNRLIDAYKDIEASLRSSVELLAEKIASGNYTRTEFIRNERYKDLLEQASNKLRDFQGLLSTEVRTAGNNAVILGERGARELLSATLTGSAGFAGQFQRLPAQTITTLLGFLDPAGPLYKRIAELAPTTVDGISQALLDGITKGLPARTIANSITGALGTGLTDAMRMTRTVTNYAYRESNRATYLANSDVVEYWQWYAHLDGNTCMSCVSQHGSIHPVTEKLADHHNGRCVMLPVTKLFGSTIPENAGAAWFDEQGENVQRKMMGRGMHEAWKDGTIQLSQLSVDKPNDVYGMMKTVPTLKDLLGGK